jgi:hypothetical protein
MSQKRFSFIRFSFHSIQFCLKEKSYDDYGIVVVAVAETQLFCTKMLGWSWKCGWRKKCG